MSSAAAMASTVLLPLLVFLWSSESVAGKSGSKKLVDYNGAPFIQSDKRKDLLV